MFCIAVIIPKRLLLNVESIIGWPVVITIDWHQSTAGEAESSMADDVVAPVWFI